MTFGEIRQIFKIIKKALDDIAKVNPKARAALKQGLLFRIWTIKT